MDVKHFVNGKEGFVFLTEEITNELANIVSAQLFAYKRQGLQPTLKINSPGGSVIAGFTIIDALISTGANTHNIGLAASMAGIILQFGKKRIINSNSTTHIHPPDGGDKEFLEIIRNQLKGILKAKSNLTDEVINSHLDKDGDDKYFNPRQTINLGLADEIININSNQVEVENKTPSQLFAVYNNLLENNSKKMDKIKEIKSALDLDENASEEKVLTHVNDLKDKVKNQASKIKDLEEDVLKAEVKNEDLEKEAKNAKQSLAEDLVENAFKSGKINEDSKEKWVKLAVENYDLAKETIGGVSANIVSVHDVINQGDGKTPFNKMTNEEKAEFAQNDPEGYNKEILKIEIEN